MRSLDAAYLLQQLGFKRVKSLVGGIDRWAQEIDPSLQRYSSRLTR
jgi:adenylyltransferase/sulfurtransferase